MTKTSPEFNGISWGAERSEASPLDRQLRGLGFSLADTYSLCAQIRAAFPRTEWHHVRRLNAADERSGKVVEMPFENFDDEDIFDIVETGHFRDAYLEAARWPKLNAVSSPACYVYLLAESAWKLNA